MLENKAQFLVAGVQGMVLEFNEITIALELFGASYPIATAQYIGIIIFNIFGSSYPIATAQFMPNVIHRILLHTSIYNPRILPHNQHIIAYNLLIKANNIGILILL